MRKEERSESREKNESREKRREIKRKATFASPGDHMMVLPPTMAECSRSGAEGLHILEACSHRRIVTPIIHLRVVMISFFVFLCYFV